jgi:hypothetical protein
MFSIRMKPVLLYLVTFCTLLYPKGGYPVPEVDSIYAHIRYLSLTIGPRPMGSSAESNALEWAAGKFRSYGADSVSIMNFNCSPLDKIPINTQSGVTIAIFRGDTDSCIVIGGHIDSAGREIPGANDNASGAATVIELARVWSQRPRRYTLLFAAFGGEERGLLGSQFFMNHYPDTSDIQLMFSLDMSGIDDAIVTLPETGDHQCPSWLLRDAFGTDRSIGLNRLSYPAYFSAINNLIEWAGSDHIPFLEQGIPAIDFTEGINHSPIHTPQDNLENIDSSMLADYAHFIQTLLTRIQTRGILQENSSGYMLWMPAGKLLFIPAPVVYAFVLASGILALAAFLISWKNRLRIEKKDRVRFSGWKVAGLGMITVLVMRSGVYFISLIKEVRHPWLVHVNAYVWLTLTMALLGGWIVLQILRFWRLSPDPTVYSKRMLITLFLFTLLGSAASIKFGIYMALTLAGFSLGVLVTAPLLKLLSLLAIIPMIRLVFHEQFTFMARVLPMISLKGENQLMLMLPPVIITLLFFLWLLPFWYHAVYLSKSIPGCSRILDRFRKPVFGGIILIVCLIHGGLLARMPAYNTFWRPSLRVEAEYNARTSKNRIRINSTEYLKNCLVTTDSLHLLINKHTLKDTIPIAFHADWLRVSGDEIIWHGTKDTLQISWDLSTSHPWHQVILTLRTDSLRIDSVSTDLKVKWDKKGLRTEWYADPPEQIRVPMQIVLEPGAGLIREVKARYAGLAVPLSIEAGLANVRYRTEVTWKDTLRWERTDSLSGIETE